MKIITCAIYTVEQLIDCPGIVLIPEISVNRRKTAGQQTESSGDLQYPGNTLMSEGLAVIFMVLPPPSETFAPSPSYKSIPGVTENITGLQQKKAIDSALPFNPT